MSKDDLIKHVIVLMLENNSFDHVLGSLKQEKNEIEGISQDNPYSNNYDGVSYSQTPYDARIVSPEPKHDLEDVMVQIAKGSDGIEMGGFVKNYVESHPHPKLADDQVRQVMGYYSPDYLPALHELASKFAVCDHWFSSVPGPTWPNRLFAMTGTSLGRVTMPGGIMDLNLHWYNQPTVFDRLDEKEISWKVYFGDFPVSSILVHQWEPTNAIRHRPMLEFPVDAARGDLPEFVWIEPSYLPPGANDYHPPHDVFDGEQLVRNVYNTIRRNDELWKSSLFVILFDEHGGFFDHVPPPTAIPPDHHQEEWTFDRLGVRVPAILVSPYVQDRVISKTFDHTSLLRYVIDKWKLGPLGERTQQAESFLEFISADFRNDTPEQLTPPAPTPFQTSPVQVLTDHESSMVSLSHALESMADEDPSVVAARSRQVLSGAASQVDAAMDRLDAFLRHRASLQGNQIANKSPTIS